MPWISPKVFFLGFFQKFLPKLWFGIFYRNLFWYSIWELSMCFCWILSRIFFRIFLRFLNGIPPRTTSKILPAVPSGNHLRISFSKNPPRFLSKYHPEIFLGKPLEDSFGNLPAVPSGKLPGVSLKMLQEFLGFL